MRALVTGACGFVGNHLARYLLECGDQVLGTVLDELPEPPPFETVVLDVTDGENCAKVLRSYLPEVIYHLAGIAFVPEAENDFGRTLQINVGGTYNIFRIAHLLSGMKVVLVSSAEVYGRISPADLPLTEEQAIRPAQSYSLSKAMSELVVTRYAQFGSVQSVILRPFNHIGPGQDNRFVASSFAYQLARIAKGLSEPIIRVGSLDAKRDFMDVRDVIRAYRLSAEKGDGIYNLCSGNPVPIQYILDTLLEVAGLDVRVEEDPARMRPSEVPELYGSVQRAKEQLGWEPEIPLAQTLKDIYQYWLTAVSGAER